MDFADAFAQVKGKLGAESREAKNVRSLAPEEQLAAWRVQMTPEEREKFKQGMRRGCGRSRNVETPNSEAEAKA